MRCGATVALYVAACELPLPCPRSLYARMRARRSPRIDWILAVRASGGAASAPAPVRRLRDEDDDDESQPSSSSSGPAMVVSPSAPAAEGRGGSGAPASAAVGGGAAGAGAGGAAEPWSGARSLPLVEVLPGTVPRSLRAMTLGTATGASDEARPMRSQREPGWMTRVRESGSAATASSCRGRLESVCWSSVLQRGERERTSTGLTLDGRTAPSGAVTSTLAVGSASAASPTRRLRLASWRRSRSCSTGRRAYHDCESALANDDETFLPLRARVGGSRSARGDSAER